MSTTPDPTQLSLAANTRPVRPSRARLVALVVFTCIASTGLGVFFGGCASIGYTIGYIESQDAQQRAWARTIEKVCTGMGAGGGLLVAGCWCAAMLRAPGTRPVRRGALGGIAAGIACTLMIHGSVAVVSSFDRGPLIIGLICGTIAGAVLGAISGRILAGPAPSSSEG